MDKSAILERFSFYQRLPKADQAAVLGSARAVSLPAGSDFYCEGDVVPQFALVGLGSIRVFKVGVTGREITLYHVQEGETCLINMLCVFLERPASANARAEAPVEAVVLPAAQFRELARRSDAVRTFVFEAMAARLIDVMTVTAEVAFRKMDERLADHLERRFDLRGQPRTEIIVTHEEIAAELGTAREVVSRLLKELERSGAVSLSRGHIQLRDVRILGEAARGMRPF